MMQVDLARIEYAGFWARFFASVLDSILQLIVFIPLLFFFVDADQLMDPEVQNSPPVFFITNVLPAIVIILFWKYRSATPGKMMMGIAIVDAETGGDPSTGKLILRFFAYIVSALPLFFGFFWVAFDKRKQGWHDKIADTLVVRLETASG